MKLIQVLVIICVTLSFITSKSSVNHKLGNKHKIHHTKISKTSSEKVQKIGKEKIESTKKTKQHPAPKQAWTNLNFPDVRNDAYVNNDPYLLQNAAGFKDAKIWPGTLPEHLNYFPYTGVFQTAETGIHNKNYYDGSLHLGKVAQINCDMYTTEPRACVNEKGCGWCGSSNTCIGASPLGPITPCVRSSFIYTLPSTEWNPLKAPAINIFAQDNNGNPLINLTHEPNLRDAPVAKPYRLD
jgi:hypothetical protein